MCMLNESFTSTRVGGWLFGGGGGGGGALSEEIKL